MEYVFQTLRNVIDLKNECYDWYVHKIKHYFDVTTGLWCLGTQGFLASVSNRPAVLKELMINSFSIRLLWQTYWKSLEQTWVLSIGISGFWGEDVRQEMHKQAITLTHFIFRIAINKENISKLIQNNWTYYSFTAVANATPFLFLHFIREVTSLIFCIVICTFWPMPFCQIYVIVSITLLKSYLQNVKKKKLCWMRFPKNLMKSIQSVTLEPQLQKVITWGWFWVGMETLEQLMFCHWNHQLTLSNCWEWGLTQPWSRKQPYCQCHSETLSPSYIVRTYFLLQIQVTRTIEQGFKSLCIYLALGKMLAKC